ncbi:microtubule-associated protein 6 isoform X1 [Monodelphis domestica]|uniref:microtubule-associated protein 6 isoform X1 n=1 Tax=Monodelphis domestica TaxID=13616 RepID=UPI0024E244EE|nr:microtubule-associated protein 6 isoform X1 [Monodelphis domestica]
MAWPCITRACCIARFWNQLDKADIAVPLVFTKYSEATDHPGAPPQPQQPPAAQPQHAPPSARSVAIETQPAPGDLDAVARATGPSGEREPGPPSAQAKATAGPGSSLGLGSADSVMRQDYRAWKVQRPEPSCKPRSEYQPSDTPFEKETQYQKDFRAWPLPRRGDHPWIPKATPPPPPQSLPAPASASPGPPTAEERRRRRQQSQERRSAEAPGQAQAPGDEEGGSGGGGGPAAGKASGADWRDTRKKAGPAWMLRRAEGQGLQGSESQPQPQQQQQQQQQQPPESGVGKGRAAADALNRQIREEVATAVSSSYRNEFRAWTDIKPVKPIRAKSQYKPPEDKMVHETSYSAQFKGEPNKPTPAENKVIDRRRIRSLYSEPFKESSKVEKPSAPTPKPKKTPTSHKPLKKAKEKQLTSGRGTKKKAPTASGASGAGPQDKEQSKEMNNKLAEAKEIPVQPKSSTQPGSPVQPSSPAQPTNPIQPSAGDSDKDQGPVGQELPAVAEIPEAPRTECNEGSPKPSVPELLPKELPRKELPSEGL